MKKQLGIRSGKGMMILFILHILVPGAKAVLFTPDTLIQGDDTLIVSGNPIITHIRNADPAAEVWNDGRVWIYSSHDKDDAVEYSTITDYHAFSSFDLVNWTDHGEILHSRDVPWGNPSGGFMFAPDAAYKDGTYYLYYPHLSNEWVWRIGVATSDVPQGPFKDAGYLEGTDNIDPVCFMDDDGQAYLIWGGGSETPKIARLKENMTELAEEPRLIDYGYDNFGEAPYMHKYNGVYYFSYTCNTCWPDQGFYTMGTSPYGPFEYKGAIKEIPPGAQDHHSMVEFHGQWYYFYHVGNYGPDGSAYRRNICVDSMFYNDDGTIREIIPTATSVARDIIGGRPGKIVPGSWEAEAYFQGEGMDINPLNDTNSVLSQINNNDWVEYVVRVLGTEIYDLSLDVNECLADGSLVLMVDDESIDTITFLSGSERIESTLYLHEGKHTFKIIFLSEDSPSGIFNLDRLSLQGELQYYPVEASASAGGNIDPPGTTYYLQGDSAFFQLKNEKNHILDSVLINGVKQEKSYNYTIHNIFAPQVIEAYFSPCRDIPATATYQVNNETPIIATFSNSITITEAQQLKISIEHGDSISLAWSGPAGYVENGNTLIIDSIRLLQSGQYMAILMNDQECTTSYTFNVEVERIKLDVYEAENYFSQSGIMEQECTDIGGGWHLGNIENNDWSYYSLNISDSAYYKMYARVASPEEGGSIEIMLMDSLLGILPVPPNYSEGWQDWFTSDTIEIPLNEGVQKLRLLYKGGSGLLFNFNWFNLEYSRPFEADTSHQDTVGKGLHYSIQKPAPFTINGSSINYSLDHLSDVQIRIYDNGGRLLKVLLNKKQEAGEYSLHWNEAISSNTSLNAGIYIISFHLDSKRYYKKLLIY